MRINAQKFEVQIKSITNIFGIYLKHYRMKTETKKVKSSLFDSN